MATEPAHINKRPLDHTGTSPPLNVSPKISKDPAASVQPGQQTKAINTGQQTKTNHSVCVR